MNSLPLSTYARIAFVTTAAVVLSACAHVRDDYRPAPRYESRVTYYDYRYYPEADSYYDTRTRVYIYFEHDHWVRARALPPRMRAHLGRHVNIRSPHDRPYEDRNRHRERYESEKFLKPRMQDHNRNVRVDTSRNTAPKPGRHDARHDADHRDSDNKALTSERSKDRHYDPVQKRHAEPAPAGPQPAPHKQLWWPRANADRQEPSVEQSYQQPDRKPARKRSPEPYSDDDRAHGVNGHNRDADKTTRNRRQATDDNAMRDRSNTP